MTTSKELNTAMQVAFRYAEQQANMTAASRALTTARMYALKDTFTEEEMNTLKAAEALLDRARDKFNLYEAKDYVEKLSEEVRCKAGQHVMCVQGGFGLTVGEPYTVVYGQANPGSVVVVNDQHMEMAYHPTKFRI